MPLGIANDYLRVIDDTGEPYLFPRSAFIVIDDRIPADWVQTHYDDGEFHANPPELHAPGFYEDYFDHKEYAVKAFDAYIEHRGLKLRHDRPRGRKKAR